MKEQADIPPLSPLILGTESSIPPGSQLWQNTSSTPTMMLHKYQELRTNSICQPKNMYHQRHRLSELNEGHSPIIRKDVVFSYEVQPSSLSSLWVSVSPPSPTTTIRNIADLFRSSIIIVVFIITFFFLFSIVDAKRLNIAHTTNTPAIKKGQARRTQDKQALIERLSSEEKSSNTRSQGHDRGS